MSKKVLATLFFIGWTGIFLLAQEVIADTTDVRYKIGYKIGTYLPITVILLVAIFFIRKAYRFKE